MVPQLDDLAGNATILSNGIADAKKVATAAKSDARVVADKVAKADRDIKAADKKLELRITEEIEKVTAGATASNKLYDAGIAKVKSCAPGAPPHPSHPSHPSHPIARLVRWRGRARTHDA